jgi:hypothetical protein
MFYRIKKKMLFEIDLYFDTVWNDIEHSENYHLSSTPQILTYKPNQQFLTEIQE